VRIWVDCDACPRAAKELIYSAAFRFDVETLLVANSRMRFPDEEPITLVIVGDGYNVADDYIAEHVASGDLVITADIPLAARIVDAGALGLDPRGQIFDEGNVKTKLAARNLMAGLREMGMTGGGPPPYKQKDRNKFQQELDRILTKDWMARNN